MIKLELTLDEANTLASLINAAVKADGIACAKAALPLFVKLEEAAQAAQSAPVSQAAQSAAPFEAPPVL